MAAQAPAAWWTVLAALEAGFASRTDAFSVHPVARGSPTITRLQAVCSKAVAATLLTTVLPVVPLRTQHLAFPGYMVTGNTF